MNLIEDKLDIEEWKPDLLNICVKSEPRECSNENVSVKLEIPEIVVSNLSIKYENIECNELENDPLSIAIKAEANHKVCNHCGKTFSKPGHLKTHVKAVHEGVKDQECNQCGKSFSQAGHLKGHVKAVHEGVKDQVCN